MFTLESVGDDGLFDITISDRRKDKKLPDDQTNWFTDFRQVLNFALPEDTLLNIKPEEKEYVYKSWLNSRVVEI